MDTLFQSNYDEILNHIENNEFNKAFDKSVLMLQIFSDKYTNLNYNMKDFRSDCKITFTCVQKIFDMDDDVLSDFDSDIEQEKDKHIKNTMIKERNEYLIFINALQYIINNIDHIDVNSSDLHEQCSIIIDYMHEKEEASKELINSLNSLCDSLKKVENVMKLIK
jgi:hypothetical protein